MVVDEVQNGEQLCRFHDIIEVIKTPPEGKLDPSRVFVVVVFRRLPRSIPVAAFLGTTDRTEGDVVVKVPNSVRRIHC